MIITIIAEPRSGSTNLSTWFSLNKDFTVLQEPLNKNGLSYKRGEPIEKWVYKTKHFLIKEIYTPTNDLSHLINFSDKIIFLYRENIQEQLESWLVASETNIWNSEWMEDMVKISEENNKISYFMTLKEGFKNQYLTDNSYFKISYEDLYFREKFQRIIEYLNIEEIENENFPYGKKYRIKRTGPRRII